MRTRFVLAIIAAISVAELGRAQPVEPEQPRSVTDSVYVPSPALDGIDPVSYFPEGGSIAARGSGELAVDHAGSTYLFATAPNRDAFSADPDRYVPMFGGHDALAMAQGCAEPADPTIFRVLGSRVFLFADRPSRDAWLAAEADLIPAASARWSESSGEPSRPATLPADLGDPSGWNVPAKGSLKGVAVDGYDPVSYFPEGGAKAAKGDKQFAFEYLGVTFRFASDANREQFKSNPERYMPCYGGWCAYAIADGEKVEIDPRSFLVTDGHLYLFYKDIFNDTRAKWMANESTLIGRADDHWRTIGAQRK